MPFSPTSPVTGAAISGLTSPTYTLTADQAPNVNSKQWAVLSLGGTQTGVDTHTASKPFTVTVFRPKAIRVLPQANPVTGVIKNVPFNTYKLKTRKGAAPASGQNNIVMEVETTIRIPAGTETYEPEEIKAMLSCHFGATWAESQDLFDLVQTGVL